MSTLLVEKGPNKGQYAKWSSNSSQIIVGRDQRATLTVDDNSASRNHFKIYKKEKMFFIEDLGSRNGTIVDGVNIEHPTVLKLGACIQIGETIFVWSNAEKKQDPLIGANLSGYFIEELLGKGGMGQVYLAKQLSLERSVALKILAPKLIRNEVFIQKFIEEARASAKLNHPNIVQVYDVAECEGKYFFSMEYAPGGSIQDIISGGRTLSIERAIECFKDTVSGLEFSEKKQIIHCDIKPDNLMIAEEGIIKIGDLGLAQSLDNKKEKEQLYGTPHYFAPERITGGVVDHRSDIYSCGATFYRILTGTTPFKGRNSKEIIRAHVNQELTPPCEINPDIPKYLQDIIMKMMAKSPDDRYDSNSLILKELNDGKKMPAVRRHSRIRSLKEEQRSPHKMRKTVFSILHNILPVIVPSFLFILGYYIFVGKPEKTPKKQIEINNVVEDEKPLEGKDQVAQKAYKLALQKHQEEGDTQYVISMLEQISKDYNDTNFGIKAQSFLNRIYKERQKNKEKKLYIMLEDVITFENENPFEYGECIARYQKIINLYPDSNQEFIKDAKASIYRLQKTQKNIEQKQEMLIIFLKYEKKIDTLIEVKKPQEASTLLDKIEIDFVNFDEVMLRIKDKRKKIIDLLHRVLIEKEKLASRLINNEKYREAIVTMKEMLEIGTIEAQEKYNILASKIKKAQEKILIPEKELVLLSAKEQKKAYELLRNYEYKESSKWLIEIAEKLKSDKAKEVLGERINHMKVLESLVERVNKKLKSKKHKNTKRYLSEKKDDDNLRILLPKFSGITHVVIKSWNKYHLTIHIPYNFSKSYIGKRIDLRKLSALWVYENLIKKQWRYNKNDLLAIATYCFYHHMNDESWKYYKKYTRKGSKAKSLLRQLKLAEKEAEKKYAEEYEPAILKLRKLLKKKKQRILDDPAELEDARKEFQSVDLNYRYRYGRTLFFLKKNN